MGCQRIDSKLSSMILAHQAYLVLSSVFESSTDNTPSAIVRTCQTIYLFRYAAHLFFWVIIKIARNHALNNNPKNSISGSTQKERINVNRSPEQNKYKRGLSIKGATGLVVEKAMFLGRGIGLFFFNFGVYQLKGIACVDIHFRLTYNYSRHYVIFGCLRFNIPYRYDAFH